MKNEKRKLKRENRKGKSGYSQQTKNRIISPKRGVIYDANGVTLARSITVETISATPKNVKEKEKTAEGLSEILGLDYQTVLDKLNKNTSEEVIAKKLDQEVITKIREWIHEIKHQKKQQISF